MRSIRIGNAAGFWGDNIDAPLKLASSGSLDYLTLEYLAELTLSILAHQRSRRPELGYVTDVPTVVRTLADEFRQQANLKLVTNGGGMNPVGCAKAVADVLREVGLGDVKVAACTGDDILSEIPQLLSAGEEFSHFETGESIRDESGDVKVDLVSANAYLGAAGIVEALGHGARVVITGRIADASLVTGPAIHEFGWDTNELDRLAGATVAGHLIECGAQSTGGIFSRWDENMDLGNIGYPIAELSSNGDCVITKPAGTGGAVTTQTVAEQLVYEIGDPASYMTPDVVADFSHVQVQQADTDRVAVTGARGKPAPETYKVSMAYRDGFAGSGMIVVAGPDAAARARYCGELIRRRVAEGGYDLQDYGFEILGAGGSMPGVITGREDAWEVVLRVSARDPRREAIDRMLRELAPLVTSGPPGITGYTGARSKSHPVLAYWPSSVHRSHFSHNVRVHTAQEWEAA